MNAAFALFDQNGDGQISKEEMTQYLTGVFMVIFEANPETESEMGVSAVELAMSTAAQCFDDCDVNHDGFLSLEEFSMWYASSM